MAITMKYAHFCDYAGLGNNGKPIVVGIFDQLNIADGQPLVMPLAFFITQLEASIADGAAHQISIVVRDEDGGEVHRVDFPTNNFLPAGPGRPLSAAVILGVPGLQFPRRGDYAFEVVVDGRRIGESPLYLMDAPPTP
jgi:uncharacterized protein DUF6941